MIKVNIGFVSFFTVSRTCTTLDYPITLFNRHPRLQLPYLPKKPCKPIHRPLP
jgi:hypothetical protein